MASSPLTYGKSGCANDFAVESLDGSLSALSGRHSHATKTAGFMLNLVKSDTNVRDIAVGGK
jgi:hypothetical protein